MAYFNLLRIIRAYHDDQHALVAECNREVDLIVPRKFISVWNMKEGPHTYVRGRTSDLNECLVWTMECCSAVRVGTYSVLDSGKSKINHTSYNLCQRHHSRYNSC